MSWLSRRFADEGTCSGFTGLSEVNEREYGGVNHLVCTSTPTIKENPCLGIPDEYIANYGVTEKPLRTYKPNEMFVHIGGARFDGYWVDEVNKEAIPKENKKVNYKFNTSSNKAINFEEIAKELSTTNPVLLVSTEEVRSKATETEMKESRKDLNEFKKGLSKKYKKGDTISSVDALELEMITDALRDLQYIDREYFVLVHSSLAQKIFCLSGEENSSTDIDELDHLLSTNDIEEGVNMFQVESVYISTVKELLQYVIDTEWSVGYKATVEVKGLL